MPAHDELPPVVSEMDPAFVSQAGAMLARAFETDPLFMHMFEQAQVREPGLRQVMGAMVRLCLAQGRVYASGDGQVQGCLCLQLPGKRASSWQTLKGWLPSFWNLGLLFARHGLRTKGLDALRLLDQLERNRPEQGHLYVEALGVDPGCQRSGFGRALLLRGLELGQGAGVRAYLETSREENVGYYERFGFQVVEQLHAGRCPTVWRMQTARL